MNVRGDQVSDSCTGIRALILAAGEGTRLLPLTLDRPKSMLPVGGKPLLQYQLDLLRAHGIRDVAINLHHCPAAITDFVGDGTRFGMTVTYSYEEDLLGSAGAAKRLESFLSETFLVLYGDVLTDVDLAELVNFHRARQAAATLALYEVPDPERCGIVVLADDGIVQQFVEKPSLSLQLGNLANAGICVFERNVLSLVPEGEPFDFGNDLFPILLERRLRMAALRSNAYVCDIGSLERYGSGDRAVREGRLKTHRPRVGCS
jgi:NDP-sugar pyrophosphorylase family protein